MTINNYQFQGKRAIVRVDFNVPLDEQGQITDDTRIRGALPTLQKILNDGGSLILMSHMGKPKGKVSEKLSLKQIIPNMSQALGPYSLLRTAPKPKPKPLPSKPVRFFCLRTCVSTPKKRASP